MITLQAFRDVSTGTGCEQSRAFRSTGGPGQRNFSCQPAALDAMGEIHPGEAGLFLRIRRWYRAAILEPPSPPLATRHRDPGIGFHCGLVRTDNPGKR